MHTSPSIIRKFRVPNLKSNANAPVFIRALEQLPGVERVDVNWSKEKCRVTSISHIDFSTIIAVAERHGLRVEFLQDSEGQISQTNMQEFYLAIDGMTCRSCEVIIERAFKKIPGVESVEASTHRGVARVHWCGCEVELDTFRTALDGKNYRISKMIPKHRVDRHTPYIPRKESVSVMRIIGFFLAAGFVFYLFTKFNLIKTNIQIGESLQIGAAFILGLVAAVSSCVATVGGLLIASVSRYQQQFVGNMTFGKKIIPVILFVVGRIVSYALLGGVLGWLGSLVTPSPAITGIIIFFAAFYMIIAGLDMLHITPPFLARCMPKMPKKISHRMMDLGMEGKAPKFLSPVLVGAGTFFIPCGFTQALQLYALTTGSFVISALVLGVFAIGTAPALSLLGLSLSSAKGNMQKMVMQFAGALVVIMGFFNIQNGFTVMGHPLSLSFFNNAFFSAANSGQSRISAEFDGKTQVIRMIARGGYEPNQFTIKAGIPVRWVIDGSNAYGCERAFQSRQLGINRILNPGMNTIEFTAPKPGAYSFSCSMGMYRGIIRAI